MFKYLKKRFEGITVEKFPCDIKNEGNSYYVRSGYMLRVLFIQTLKSYLKS